jgi:hypothetical protein
MRKIFILFSIFFILGVSAMHAQNEKFKALYIYNFTKYLEWPDSFNEGNFVIAVLGNSPIVDELIIIAAKRKIGFQPIVVEKINSVSEVDNAHILFIPPGKSNQIASAVNQLKDKPTMIITDKSGSIGSGACINFIVQSGKQKFEISKDNILARDIKVGSDLLSLGIIK